MTSTAVAVFVSAVLVCFSACSRTDQKSSGPVEKITIAYSAPPYTVLIDIAEAQGYFRQEGLEATLQAQGHGKLALEALAEGKADFATAGSTPIILAIMDGEKISLISSIQSSNRNNAIAARKDRGILAPKDLKGKKTAATLGTIREFFLDSFLVVNGLSRKDVTVVDLGPAEMLEAISNGSVDAVSALSPDPVRIQKMLGDKGIMFYDENIYTAAFNIVSTQEYILRNPRTIEKLLRALVKAEEFARQSPSEAQKNVAEARQIDKVLLGEIWDANDFSVKLDQSLLLSLEDESRWAIKNKLTTATKVPNYLDYIYRDGLASVKPEAVRILK
ncbi:MAG: NrtA/SsuA/CpmA family ABC transporter substrate-binding protein [Nitrospirae bacterium]|nr:NrtA/SsuA/CpmA family ABC transporter substrate-binding protein [Nitrospirota bacterium]